MHGGQVVSRVSCFHISWGCVSTSKRSLLKREGRGLEFRIQIGVVGV